MRRFHSLWLVICVFSLLGSILVGRVLEAKGGAEQLGDEPPYLPSPTFLRHASLGYRAMVADLLWIRTTQYFGKELETPKEREKKYRYLLPLLELTVSLDPQFIDAYRLGGLLLIVVRRPEEAIALYEKGYAANPDRWENPHDLGRLYYLELKDYEKALHWWKITEKLPGRPDYIPRFIPRLYAQTGQREIAIELWLEMFQRTDNAYLRNLIQDELRRLGVQVQ
jgi:tetratricopeptide (TPR) repeat protein